MMPDPETTPFLTVADAGRFLGIGRSAAYDAAKRGELATIRIGRRLLVPTAALRRMAQLESTRDRGAARPGGHDDASVSDTTRGGVDVPRQA